MDILKGHPVRKTKKQKQAFRCDVQAHLENLGYTVTVEKGMFGCHNLLVGNPETARYLVTAHYDTCARMPVPNLITPCNLPLFLLYQLFVTVVIVIPPVLANIVLTFLFDNPFLGSVCMSVGIWIMLALLLFGPANGSNANDNTSGVITLLEIARTLPENQRGKVCFVLFDLEEAGLIGSASYRKAHKSAAAKQLVLNLDCVGDGDRLMMFPTRALRKNRKKLASLYKACGYFGRKSLTVHQKGFAIYPSDQANFPYGVGICALKESKFGFYLGRIHTSRDTVLEETNVNILRAALTNMICCDADQ